jgi:peptide/nickel transport system ATP-binding protein
VFDADAGLVRAIDGLSLAIERGETFALVGESGCGKSMTALALMRLLPDAGRVSAGRIDIDGNDTLALPEAAMRRLRGGKVGMIFQEPATSLNPVMRIGAQIVEAIEAHTALRGAPARAKAIEWLGRVGIPEPERRVDDYPFRLSGGQKQRVMIAIALAAEPDFLVADEPTTALDVAIQAQILDLLKDLQREQGMGMLLITHDLAVVSGMAQRVALMYAGQIVEVASAAEFFAEPAHPYARLLLQSLPTYEKRGVPLAAITGTVPSMSQVFAGCRFAPRCDRAFDRCRSEAPTLLPLAAAGASALREVRCWLHVPSTGVVVDAAVPLQPASLAASPASAREARADQDTLLLDVQSLSVKFPIRSGLLQRVKAHSVAVSDVSISIPRGSTLALVGESGCGKTTLGKAIVQLLRGTAVIEGRAMLEGRDLFKLQGEPLRLARRSVQMIFQDPYASLNPRLSVEAMLTEVLYVHRIGTSARDRRDRAAQLLVEVGLGPEHLPRYPHEFSGGQRQRQRRHPHPSPERWLSSA